MGKSPMKPQLKKTKRQFNQEIINNWPRQHPDCQDWQMEDIAADAIRRGLWIPPLKDEIRMCAAELSSAAREEYFTDQQGRRVRRKHARRETTTVDGERKQLVFWADIETATPQHMRVSL